MGAGRRLWFLPLKSMILRSNECLVKSQPAPHTHMRVCHEAGILAASAHGAASHIDQVLSRQPEAGQAQAIGQLTRPSGGVSSARPFLTLLLG